MLTNLDPPWCGIIYDKETRIRVPETRALVRVQTYLFSRGRGAEKSSLFEKEAKERFLVAPFLDALLDKELNQELDFVSREPRRRGDS